MPSRGRKFITEFLLPSLNEKRFGTRLMWLDIEKKIFQMQWNHKSSSDWTTSDAAVFAAWDKRKGHYKPDDKEYYSKSKQRFRAALYKFIKHKHITELYSEDKYTKIYCIGDEKNVPKTSITIAKTEKDDGNKNTSQKIKQNPEDLVLDIDSIWNVNLLTESEENSMATNHNPHMKGGCFIEGEQVVTDYTDESIPEALYSENPLNCIQSLNSSSGYKKSFYARETSNTMKENDVKSLHVDIYLLQKNIYKKDNLKNLETIESDNCHDYLQTVRETPREWEWLDYVLLDGTDGNLSFDLPLMCT